MPLLTRRHRAYLTGGLVLAALLQVGCSTAPASFDADQAKQALLTESEMPGPGWHLDAATATPPTFDPSAPTLASGPCQDALRVIDTAGQGATVYVKGTYSRGTSLVVDVAIQSFETVPDGFLRFHDLVAACQSGQITSGPEPVTFRLTSPAYPASSATGATLTVEAPGGPQVLDVALLVRDRIVVTATGAGADPASVPSVLDQTLAAQSRKMSAVRG